MTTDQFVTRYSFGMCDALALALMQVVPDATDLGLLVQIHEDEDGLEWETPLHAFVFAGEEVIDCHGRQHQSVLLERFPVAEGVTRLKVATAAELEFTFTTEGVAAEQVRQALADAEAAGLLPLEGPGSAPGL